MSGQTNKRLCGFVVDSDKLISAGARLMTGEGKDVGWITSATRSERLGKQIALGFVKRGIQNVGTVLTANSPDTMRCEVAALPFADA